MRPTRPSNDLIEPGFAAAIVETIRQPLVVLDERMRVLEANPAFYRAFHGNPAETVGSHLFDLGGAQWDIPTLRDGLVRVLSDDVPLDDLEVRHTFGGIGDRALLVNARQVAVGEKGERLLLVAFEDVTDRRRAERAARHYAEQLERSNRELGEFAHVASHDLQEPLRKVRAFTSRLLASLDPGQLNERQRDYAARLDAAAERMQQRIDDLLVLARVGREQPARQAADLNSVVARALSDLSIAIERSGAQVHVNELPTIQAEPAHFELVFQNLVSNAIKFARADTPPRIQISAQSHAPPAHDDRDWVRLRVADNGIGFDPQYADRIFRPFERLHGRDEYQGSGVGLSIVRRVAELYGGSATADGIPGNGACFELILPTTQLSEEP